MPEIPPQPRLFKRQEALTADLLGGSWVVISGVISPLIWVITIVILLVTLLITTHEPPLIEPLWSPYRSLKGTC